MSDVRTSFTHVSRHRSPPWDDDGACAGVKNEVIVLSVVEGGLPSPKRPSGSRCRDGGCVSFWPATASLVSKRSGPAHERPDIPDDARHHTRDDPGPACDADQRRPGRGRGIDPGPHHRLRAGSAVPSHDPAHPAHADPVTPQPHKRPRSSWTRFEAALPNETWQSDMTHWHLADDHRRGDHHLARRPLPHDHLHISAHRVVTATIVVDTFTASR